MRERERERESEREGESKREKEGGERWKVRDVYGDKARDKVGGS